MRFLSRDGRCQIGVVLFPDHRRNADGRLVFEFDGAIADVALPFWRALRRLQTLLPEDEFEKRWRAPFPAHEMSALTALFEKDSGRVSGRSAG